jgi:hypothetical protein
MLHKYEVGKHLFNNSLMYFLARLDVLLSALAAYILSCIGPGS